MLRQALSAGGSLFSKIYRPRHSEIQRCLTTGQRRAFHISPRLRYDDDNSSYGTISKGSSSYDTIYNSGSSRAISSNPSTGLGSFMSGTSTFRNNSSDSHYTTPNPNSSITSAKISTMTAVNSARTSTSSELDPAIILERKPIQVEFQGLSTDLKALTKELKDFNMTVGALIAKSGDVAIRPAEAPLPLPKISAWESYRKKGLPVAFWGNACLCAIFVAGLSYLCTLDQIRSGMNSLKKAQTVDVVVGHGARE